MELRIKDAASLNMVVEVLVKEKEEV